MSDNKSQQFLAKKLEKIKKELGAAVKMHSSQAERIGTMLKGLKD